MLRSIIAVTVGVLLGVCIVIFASFFAAEIAPIPESLDPISADAMKRLPLTNKLIIISIWALGAFLGAIAASYISRRWAPASWVVASAMLLFAISNFASFPAPIWMVFASLGAIISGGYLAVAATGARYKIPGPKSGSDRQGRLI